jgi:multidrug efflux pump subunit AcrB
LADEESDGPDFELVDVQRAGAMIILMMVVIIFRVRSISAMAMVLLRAPLALVGVVPMLLLFNQPFGFTPILALIALAGIIMRDTLILIGQIHQNEVDGLDPYHAVMKATVQRARPVILTALAAVLAFIPLTFSVFWGALAFTLIGGTIGGTVLTLVFLPALYAIWYRIKPEHENTPKDESFHREAPAAGV